MSARPDRGTQQALLLLLGVVVLFVAGSDRYLDYVRAGFRPFLLAAGVVLVLVAVGGWVGPRSREEHPGPGVGWLLAAPVAVVLVVAPPALGSYTASRQATASVTSLDAAPSAALGANDPGTDHRTMTLFDYFVAVQQPDRSAIEGRRVRLVGFVSPRAAGGWYVTRFVVNCCAADATAVRIAVPDGPAGFEADQWVEVIGTAGDASVDPAVGHPEPAVDALSVRAVEPPAEPYE